MDQISQNLLECEYKFLARTNSHMFLTLCNKLSTTLQRHDTAQNIRILQKSGSEFVRTKTHFAPSPYLKAMSNKTVVQIKLVRVAITFHYTKLHLSECNSS
jgi:hypothetical protein